MGTAGIGRVVLVHVFTQTVPAGVLARYRRGGRFAGAAGRDARRARKPVARPTGGRAGSRVSHRGRRRAAPSIRRPSVDWKHYRGLPEVFRVSNQAKHSHLGETPAMRAVAAGTMRGRSGHGADGADGC